MLAGIASSESVIVTGSRCSKSVRSINAIVPVVSAIWKTRGVARQTPRMVTHALGRIASIDTPCQHGRTTPRVLVLHANGSNRDRDAALACELAGAEADIVHVNQLISGERKLLDYHMLVVPGGFSYGDDLGAGKLWALDLRQRFEAGCRAFCSRRSPGDRAFATVFRRWSKRVCCRVTQNVKVTLTYNASAHFECRWVYLAAESRTVHVCSPKGWMSRFTAPSHMAKGDWWQADADKCR